MADLFDVLTESGKRKQAAPEFLKRLGLAVVKNPVVAGAALGAAIIGGGQYLAARPDKTGLSREQRTWRRAERVAKSDAQALKSEKREPTMRETMTSITAKPMSQLADLAAKHPVKAGLLAAPVGAKTGATLARLFTK